MSINNAQKEGGGGGGGEKGGKDDQDTSISTQNVDNNGKPTTTESTTTAATLWPKDATEEICTLITYNTEPCSCGTLCSSFSREYFAYAPNKCNDTILRTGEFGKEPCGMSYNVLYIYIYDMI